MTATYHLLFSAAPVNLGRDRVSEINDASRVNQKSGKTGSARIPIMSVVLR